MTRRFALCLVVGLLLAPLTLPVLGQDGPPDGQLYRVHIYQTQVGSAAAYDAALANLFGAYKKNGVDFPTFTSVSVSDPGTYSYVIPMDSMGDWDAQQQKLGVAWQSVPEVVAELQGMNLSNDTRIVAYRKGLSYTPASPRLTGDETNFWMTYFLHAKPSEVAAIEAVMLEIQALYKKKDLNTGFGVFQQVIGNDSPTYAVRIGAKDPADFYANQDKLQGMIGAEMAPLFERLGKACRSMETSTSMSRPDLSYVP